MATQQRTAEQLREHYEIEKQLAQRLFSSTAHARKTLYSVVYDELFQRVPHHPQLGRKHSSAHQAAKVARQLRWLHDYLRPDSCYMEIGPGDCALSIGVAPHVRKVYAIDVSHEITKGLELPPNFELILSDGCTVPVPAESVDIAFSNQLMEHLHPDDAFEQLQNIYNALVPGGAYLCITPNRLSGPHDVSRHFDSVATGFHLHEYTVTELATLFKKVGFANVWVYVCVRQTRLYLPHLAIQWIEVLLETLPHAYRKRIAAAFPLNIMLGVTLIGIK